MQLIGTQIFINRITRMLTTCKDHNRDYKELAEKLKKHYPNRVDQINQILNKL